jgi:hypothetical protein
MTAFTVLCRSIGSTTHAADGNRRAATFCGKMNWCDGTSDFDRLCSLVFIIMMEHHIDSSFTFSMCLECSSGIAQKAWNYLNDSFEVDLCPSTVLNALLVRGHLSRHA